MSKKIVLITGTNSGFGWLMAQSVAALGHRVYATMRDINGKNADRARALNALENITVLDVELTNDLSITAAVDQIISKEGRIDVLVNNAGAAMFGVAEASTPTDVQRIFDINFFGPWKLMKRVLPTMRQHRAGLIINVTSGYGRVSFPFSSVYAASKFALEGLSEGLHYEVRPLGIDVSILEPGAFPTEMSTKVHFGADSAVAEDYKVLDEYAQKMFAALGKLIEDYKPDPQSVADAVVSLLEAPAGKRPLRTVVDPTTGPYIQAINDTVEVEFDKGMTAYGLKELLH